MIVRSILSVVAGFGLWSVLWLGGNAALVAIFPTQFNEDRSTTSTGMLIAILMMSIIWSVASGYLTALIGRSDTYLLPIILGVILLGVGIAVQSSYWNIMPLWYHLIFLVMLIPGVLLGAYLRMQ